jgi:hypothetical protein
VRQGRLLGSVKLGVNGLVKKHYHGVSRILLPFLQESIKHLSFQNVPEEICAVACSVSSEESFREELCRAKGFPINELPIVLKQRDEESQESVPDLQGREINRLTK